MTEDTKNQTPIQRRLLEEHRLSASVHKKTIQKAVDSIRISEERKQYLKSLRIR